MLVAAHDRQAMLEREGGYPSVVCRNRTAEFLQRHAHTGVRHGGGFGDREDFEVREVVGQPLLVLATVPGSTDAVAELSQHDDRDGDVRFDSQPGADRRFAVDERRQRVRVEDQRRSSGSTTSNSRSMIR